MCDNDLNIVGHLIRHAVENRGLDHICAQVGFYLLEIEDGARSVIPAKKREQPHHGLRRMTRIASNRLTGMPTALAALRQDQGRAVRPSIRMIWKAIRDTGTVFAG